MKWKKFDMVMKSKLVSFIISVTEFSSWALKF